MSDLYSRQLDRQHNEQAHDRYEREEMRGEAPGMIAERQRPTPCKLRPHMPAIVKRIRAGDPVKAIASDFGVHDQAIRYHVQKLRIQK